MNLQAKQILTIGGSIGFMCVLYKLYLEHQRYKRVLPPVDRSREYPEFGVSYTTNDGTGALKTETGQYVRSSDIMGITPGGEYIVK